MVVCTALATGGTLLLQHAMYLDGDADALWGNRWLGGLTHTPRHPLAVRARRQALVCLGLSVILAGAGAFLLRVV